MPRSHLPAKTALEVGRRTVLLAGLVLACRPALATPMPSLRLRPARAPVQVTTTASPTSCQIVFSGPETDGISPVTLACPDVVLFGHAPLAGRDLLLARFPAGKEVTLLALVGWDGSRARVLGIEPLSVQAQEGPALAVHLSATPDASLLRLFFQVSGSRTPTVPFHRSWIDLLGFREQAPLADLAVRPPMPDSLQAHLTSIRARTDRMLATSDNVTLAALADTGLLDLPRRLADELAAARPRQIPPGMAGE